MLYNISCLGIQPAILWVVLNEMWSDIINLLEWVKRWINSWNLWNLACRTTSQGLMAFMKKRVSNLGCLSTYRITSKRRRYTWYEIIHFLSFSVTKKSYLLKDSVTKWCISMTRRHILSIKVNHGAILCNIYASSYLLLALLLPFLSFHSVLLELPLVFRW